MSAKLTTEAISGLLKQTDIDKKDPKAVAGSSSRPTAWPDPPPGPVPGGRRGPGARDAPGAFVVFVPRISGESGAQVAAGATT